MSPKSHPPFQKLIGELLVEAKLLTPAQVQVALYDQQQFATMRLGEIFVFRGWLKQQTADFFGDRWHQICSPNINVRQTLGEYLCAAGLMDEQCIHQVIEEQHRNGYRFGANAVLLGFLKQETLDYFLEHLFPDEKNEAHYVFNGKQRIMQSQQDVDAEISSYRNTQTSITTSLDPRDTSLPKVYPPAADDEISWVG